MQAALAGFAALPPPAARADVLAGLHCTRARGAADARKAAVMQCVVRQALFADVVPHLVLRPFEQRTHLVKTIFAVPFHGRRQRPAGRLTPPDARNPGAAARDGAAERLPFARPAASETLLETVAEPVDAVLSDPAFQFHGLGIVDGQGAAVALLYPIDEIIGLRIQPPGINAEDLDFRHGTPNQIGQHDGFRP